MIPSCVPFQDPITDKDDEEKLIEFFVERVNGKDLEANYYEKSRTILRRFLIDAHHNLEVAYESWVKFITWRKNIGADSILDEHIKNETDMKLGYWKGKDLKGSKCCIITGRQLHPGRQGCYSSFYKFVIRLVEEGCLFNSVKDQDSTGKVCVIYDRRGLKSSNIDPMLYTVCRQTIEDLTFWYGNNLETLYIVNMSWFFWISFYFLIKPFVQNKVVAVQKRSDLLKYFDDHELYLLPYDDGWENEVAPLPELTESTFKSSNENEVLREVKFNVEKIDR